MSVKSTLRLSVSGRMPALVTQGPGVHQHRTEDWITFYKGYLGCCGEAATVWHHVVLIEIGSTWLLWPSRNCQSEMGRNTVKKLPMGAKDRKLLQSPEKKCPLRVMLHFSFKGV